MASNCPAVLPNIHPARCLKFDYTGRSFETKNMDLSNVKIDMLSGRPRTPNDQYTVLTEQQLGNMQKNAKPFFQTDNADPGPLKRPAPIDRYAVNTSQFLFRDNPPKNHPHCWIDQQWQRDPPADHNTSRLGASLRWGPQKTGDRTISHFHQEDVHRYLNIDVYKRNPSNIPSMTHMKYGRPSEGYYQQRNPSFNTWFGSTHQLNETNVLTNIQPKTKAQYAQQKKDAQLFVSQRCGKFPDVSEYTVKYLLDQKEPCALRDMDAKKEFHRTQKANKIMAA